jgi:hypothetical protein
VSSLRLDDPLVFSKSLAVELGLNEAIILHQLNYWLQRSKNIVNGRRWAYNTLEEWAEQFPFLSPKTVQRTLSSLRAKGIIDVDNSLNKTAFDRTNWYTINYEAVNKVPMPSPKTDAVLTPTEDGALPLWDEVHMDNLTESDMDNLTESDSANLGSSNHKNTHKTTDIRLLTEDSPLQGARRGKASSATKPKSDAVLLFREFTNRWPNKAGQELIDLHVSDLETWRFVLGEWLTRGYRPVNVKGMVEWYKNPSLCENNHNVKGQKRNHQDEVFENVESMMKERGLWKNS